MGAESRFRSLNPRSKSAKHHVPVAEWLKALDCKSGERKLHVGSNPIGYSKFEEDKINRLATSCFVPKILGM